MSAVFIRPAVVDDAQAIAQLRVDAWRATYRGMMPDTYLEAMSVPDNAAFWARILSSGSPNASVWVSHAGERIVGFASANLRDSPKFDLDGELSAIYIAADCKRQGIGRRLVATVAAAQRARGIKGLITWVIAKNQPARAFYERLGGDLIAEQTFQWDGVDLVEVGYAFRDLDALAALNADNPALH